MPPRAVGFGSRTLGGDMSFTQKRNVKRLGPWPDGADSRVSKTMS